MKVSEIIKIIESFEVDGGMFDYVQQSKYVELSEKIIESFEASKPNYDTIPLNTMVRFKPTSEGRSIFVSFFTPTMGDKVANEYYESKIDSEGYFNSELKYIFDYFGSKEQRFKSIAGDEIFIKKQ